MILIRCLLLAAACALLLFCPPSSFPFPLPLLLTDGQLGRALKFTLALWLVRDINAGLTRWAENRWMWTANGGVWNWSKEIAVVTGGSQGIGAAVVKSLVSHGITVAVLDVQPLSEELQNDKSDLIRFYQCDITSRDAVRQTGEAIRSHHGAPTILINNAGIGNANSILDVTPARLRAIFDVNLLSHWNTVQQFLPDMIANKKGHILSVASLAAFVGLANMTDYCCTKAGLMAFHEGLTQELKHRYGAPQVLTSIVYPSWTQTNLTKAIEKGIRGSGASIVEPADVGKAIAAKVISSTSGQLVLGPGLAASVRALPMWVQEWIRDRMAQVVTVNATTASAAA
ncbi:NAD(P)-binding protein [Polyplosphaeria fusca]|uniref:Short-chain dehydrogenase/reductase 3 n=1 Tax=Polyplosphaeria fusca TaxID=682080 RepID=A0A9P4RAQ4_9PLEO|nr:NAD(P)-binding protein [Polyplosphaeria fusca]